MTDREKKVLYCQKAICQKLREIHELVQAMNPTVDRVHLTIDASGDKSHMYDGRSVSAFGMKRNSKKSVFDFTGTLFGEMEVYDIQSVLDKHTKEE